MDVARRIAAFEFASRACDVVFGDVYSLPKVPRPLLCDRENPMEVFNDEQFLARYRFTKDTVRELLSMLPLQDSRDNRGLPLTPMLQLLVTLRFYGAGTFQVVTGDLVHISQPTACRAIGRVTRLIASHLFRELVHFPDASDFTTVMRDFYEIANFPGVTGCIDCTHVRIKSPGGDNAEVFRNRKGVFSINVQVGSPFIKIERAPIGRIKPLLRSRDTCAFVTRKATSSEGGFTTDVTAEQYVMSGGVPSLL